MEGINGRDVEDYKIGVHLKTYTQGERTSKSNF